MVPAKGKSSACLRSTWYLAENKEVPDSNIGVVRKYANRDLSHTEKTH